MDRQHFVIATAVILFAAFLLGWFASWVVHRLTRVTRAELGELDELSQQLHDAEAARDEAVMALETREGELTGRLSNTTAAYHRVQDELREAQAEIEELRAYIDRKTGRG